MSNDQIKYYEGFKYQLAEDYIIQTGLYGHEVDEDFFSLTKDGLLTIKKGYAWDGASGPALDTDTIMRGSLVHDVLYEMLRKQLIDERYRKYADLLFKQICLEDGMNEFRADCIFKAVDVFAGSAADPKNKRKVKVAPEDS